MAKRAGPSWWKMYAHNRAAIASLSDEEAGAVLKAAFKYFCDGEVDTVVKRPGVHTAFMIMKEAIDESYEDYTKAVEYGRRGGNTRWGNED